MTGTVAATVENGGNAFYVKNGQSLTGYLNNSFTERKTGFNNAVRVKAVHT